MREEVNDQRSQESSELWECRVQLGTPCTGEGCNISPEIYLVLFRRIRVILYDPSLPPPFFLVRLSRTTAINSN